ncbi:MAG: hypothetical protein AMXMBFR36_21500 [Acidobacteriota bacterium]
MSVRAVGAISLVLVLGCGRDWRGLDRSADGFVAALPGEVVCGPHERTNSLGGSTVATESCSARVFAPWIVGGESAEYAITWFRLPSELADEGVDAVVARMFEGESEQARPIRRRSAVLAGERAVEVEWVIEGSELSEGASAEAASAFEYTTRTRYVLGQGVLVGLSVQGILDSWHERTWTEFVASFRFSSAR